jgi:hypothetical protein
VDDANENGAALVSRTCSTIGLKGPAHDALSPHGTGAAANEVTLEGLGAPVDLESFQWGSVTGSASTGMGAGKVAHDAKLTYLAKPDDPIYKWALGGPKTITVTEQGPKGALQIELQNAVVSSFALVGGGASGMSARHAAASIAFERMKETYPAGVKAPPNANPGSLGWDLMLNAPH